MKCHGLGLLASLAVLCATPASADARNDVMTGMARCASVADNRAWLDCLYGAAQPMRALLGLPPAPQAQLVPQPGLAPARSPIPAPVPQFDARQQSMAPIPNTAMRVHERLTSFIFDDHGYFTVSLANGQSWQQEAGDTNSAHWTKAASAYVADITNGAFGSHNMRVTGDGGTYKVRRVR